MAKTALELVLEAGTILQEVARGEVAGSHAMGGCLSTRELPAVLIARSQAWLKEDIAEEGGASHSSQSDEPPTDDRWFAAYLKAQDSVMTAFLPEVLQLLQAGTQATKARARELLCKDAPDFVKEIADRALSAAREQARETLP